jgi:hypothetical protein
MPDTPAAAEPTCPANKGPLLCMLDDGHDGLHYDDIDHISWTEGRTDA